jgi:hypothetical protein
MTSIKVYWNDGSGFTPFSSTNGIVLVYDQFWLIINDSSNTQIGLVPRENIKYVTTQQDAVAQ